MTIKFDVTEVEDHYQVLLSGRIDAAAASRVEEPLLDLYKTPGNRVIVDLSELSFITSAGLRVMLMAAKRASKSGGRLVLCGLLPEINQVFKTSGFLKILDVVDDRETAANKIRS